MAGQARSDSLGRTMTWGPMKPMVRDGLAAFMASASRASFRKDGVEV
jgi:hypothetical protein